MIEGGNVVDKMCVMAGEAKEGEGLLGPMSTCVEQITEEMDTEREEVEVPLLGKMDEVEMPENFVELDVGRVKHQELDVSSFARVMTMLFMSTLGISLLIPVLPSLLLDIVGGDSSKAAYISGILGVFSMPLDLLVVPYLGAVSDRTGRRLVLIVGLIGYILEMSLLAVFRTLPVYILSRYMSSIGSVFYTTANACVADLVVGTGKEPVYFGVLGVVAGGGFALGPIVGGLIVGAFSEAAALWFSVGLFALTVVFILLLLPETLKEPQTRPVSLSVVNFTRLFYQTKYLSSLVLTQFFVNFTTCWHAIAFLYFHEKLGWEAADIGTFISVAGVVAIVNQGILTKHAIRALGEYPVLKVGFFSELGYLLMLTFASRNWQAYASLVVGSFGWIAMPTLRAIIARQVPASEQGSLQGSLSAMNTLQTGVGSLIMSLVFGVFASHEEGKIFIPNAPFAFIIVNMIIATVFLFRSEKWKPDPQPTKPNEQQSAKE